MPVPIYVSCAKSDCIEVVGFDLQTGALTHLDRTRLSGNGMPLAVAPDGQHLYAAVFGETDSGHAPRLASYAIAGGSGVLTRIGEIPAPGRMSFITTDRTGQYLLGASVAGDLISSHAIASDGSLVAEPVVVRAVPGKAHQITTDITNRFAFVPNLGAGLVQQLAFSAASGHLTGADRDALELDGNCGPRHLAHHPAGRFVALLCEMDGALVILELEPSTGRLAPRMRGSILPDAFTGTPWGAHVLFSPDGIHLYSSERRSSTIAVQRFDATTGAIERVCSMPTLACPRHFAIDPDGRWLVVAGEDVNRIASYAIDRRRGTLAAAAELAVGDGPIWVAFNPAAAPAVSTGC